MAKHDVEYWWITREGALTLAEVYKLDGVAMEAFVTGIEGPVSIAAADLVTEIHRPQFKGTEATGR